MKFLFALLLLSSSVLYSQTWNRKEIRDEVRNANGVQFSIPAKEDGVSIEINCYNGKLDTAWLETDQILNSDGNSRIGLEYRRDDEAKPHRMYLPVSEGFHNVQLQARGGFFSASGEDAHGLTELLYGNFRKLGKNLKENNYAHHLIVGLPVYPERYVSFHFDIPDPATMRQECQIRE